MENQITMSANAKTVLEYLQQHDGENHTHHDVAEGTGLPAKSVSGVFTMAIQKKGWGIREEATVEVEGAVKTVKFLRLTDEGRALNLSTVAVKA